MRIMTAPVPAARGAPGKLIRVTTSEGTPGRYSRSFGGLVVALVVTVVIVGVVLWVLSLFRHDVEIRPDNVDYLSTVEGAQDAGLHPVYPAELPEGWIATGAEVPPGEDRAFEVRLLTDDERFIGIHQEAGSSAGQLVASLVDEDTTAVEAYRTPHSVAEDWEGFADDGGDTAYVAELGKQTVIVWGSAPAEDLQQVIDLLTQAPLR